MSGPKAPRIKPAPPAPIIDQARVAADEEQARSRRRGRAAAMLSGARGDMNAPPTATRQLLG